MEKIWEKRKFSKCFKIEKVQVVLDDYRFQLHEVFFMERFYEKLTREVDLSEESSVVQIKGSLDFKVD